MKTLRDLEFEQITDLYFNAHGEQRFSRRGIVFTYHLREEAIRQIEQLKDEITTSINETNILSKTEIIRYIKKFFNINNDELKENETNKI